MAGPDLSNYIEVHDRISAFHERYPDGSLQGRHWMQDVDGKPFLVYQAKAYRTPDDKRPGIGHAWEPIPGLTPYTKGSELMVGETSAWGRALAALGFEVNKSIASREEVAARQDGDGASEDRPPTAPQLDYLLGKGNRKGLIDKAPLSDEARVRVKAWATHKLTFEKASRLIEVLKEDAEKGAAFAANAAGFTDIPVDDEDLPTVDEAVAQDTRPVTAE